MTGRSELHDKCEVHQYVTAYCEHVVKNCNWMFHSCDIRVDKCYKDWCIKSVF